MKTLKTSLYRAMASILVSDNAEFKSIRNVTLFSQVLSIYPSKVIYALVAHRVISFYEKNIFKIDLLKEVMTEEGEDQEVINTIDELRASPEVTTSSEVTELCIMFADYIKWSRILKKKDSFLSSDKDAMKHIVAETIDARSSDKVICTGVRGLNMILSPGYLGGYVYVYSALPGCYKSGILLKGHVDTLKYNTHLKNITGGKTPVSMYISMENTMTQTIRRLWSLLYPSADMSMFTVDEVTDMIEQALTVNGMRSVILYYGYREKSTRDLQNIIQGYNTDKMEVVMDNPYILITDKKYQIFKR